MSSGALATKLLFLTCQSVADHTTACEAVSKALYQTEPRYYRQLNEFEEEVAKYVTPEMSAIFSVINAINKQEVNVTIINIKF